MPRTEKRPDSRGTPAKMGATRTTLPHALRADLHIHTTASDSRWTPEQVIAGCLAEGIGLLAVADHDTVASVLHAEALAHAAGLAFIRAVEVSTATTAVATGERIIPHVLGYGIDPRDPVLHGVLAENFAMVQAIDDADISGLIELGYDLDYADYLAYDYDHARGGFKSLNYCIDHGICTGLNDFFTNVRAQLDDPWPDFPSPREAIAVIRGAGGFPVLAHPGATFRNHGGVTEAALAPFLDDGIAGLECYSQYHDVPTTRFCVDWCDAHDLLITGGSDYHGGFVGRQLGVPVVDTTQLRLGRLAEAVGSRE